MQKPHHLSDEVGKIDRLIAAISSEIETERAATDHCDGLLREMEDAVAELRLARGVRLMLLNAYGVRPGAGAPVHSRVTGGQPSAGWPRTGRRVA